MCGPRWRVRESRFFAWSLNPDPALNTLKHEGSSKQFNEKTHHHVPGDLSHRPWKYIRGSVFEMSTVPLLAEDVNAERIIATTKTKPARAGIPQKSDMRARRVESVLDVAREWYLFQAGGITRSEGEVECRVFAEKIANCERQYIAGRCGLLRIPRRMDAASDVVR